MKNYIIYALIYGENIKIKVSSYSVDEAEIIICNKLIGVDFQILNIVKK